MRVSAKTDYALRAAVELAAAGGGGGPVKGERLATSQSIPLRFLENILLQLRHAGIVESRRGADGGYKLARPAEEITLADVIRAIDGPLALAPCVSQMAFRKCDDCPDLETCALRPALRQARDATAHVLEAYTLQAALDDTGGLRTAAVVDLA